MLLSLINQFQRPKKIMLKFLWDSVRDETAWLDELTPKLAECLTEIEYVFSDVGTNSLASLSERFGVLYKLLQSVDEDVLVHFFGSSKALKDDSTIKPVLLNVAHLHLPVSLLGDFNTETLLPILDKVTRDYSVGLISKTITGQDTGDGNYSTEAVMRSAIDSMNLRDKAMSFLVVNQGGHHYSLSVIAKSIPQGQQKFSLTGQLMLLHFDSKHHLSETEDSYLGEYQAVTDALLKDFNTAAKSDKEKGVVLCKESIQVADYCGLSCVVAARTLTLLQDTDGKGVRLLNRGDFPVDPAGYSAFADEISLNVSDLTILWSDTDFEADAAAAAA